MELMHHDRSGHALLKGTLDRYNEFESNGVVLRSDHQVTSGEGARHDSFKAGFA